MNHPQELDGSLEHLVSSQDQITKSLIYLGDYEGALASHRRVEEYLNRLGRSPNEKQFFYVGVIHLYSGNVGWLEIPCCSSVRACSDRPRFAK